MAASQPRPASPLRDRPDALAAAFRQYRPLVVRVLARICADHAEAEELAQETFVALGEQPLDPHRDDLRAWLLRTAIRRGLNAKRGRLRRGSREAAVGPALAGTPAPSAEYFEQRSRVKRTLQQLTETQQSLLVLRAAGLRYAELARTLDLHPNSVGTMLARAQKAFAAAYERPRQGDTDV